MKGCEFMPKILDITGQRFGSLTALKKVKSRGGKTYWLCQCDCGNQKEIQTSHLTSGATKSCGCQKKNPLTEIEEERICILCGEKFIANNENAIKHPIVNTSNIIAIGFFPILSFFSIFIPADNIRYETHA